MQFISFIFIIGRIFISVYPIYPKMDTEIAIPQLFQSIQYTLNPRISVFPEQEKKQ